jgi:hypothetical protein
MPGKAKANLAIQPFNVKHLDDLNIQDSVQQFKTIKTPVRFSKALSGKAKSHITSPTLNRA